MRRSILSFALPLALVAAGAESQPRLPAALDQAVIRVQSHGNELIVMRRAPVAYSTLGQMYAGIAAPRASSRSRSGSLSRVGPTTTATSSPTTA